MGRWTTIDQDVREEFALTLNEYAIADSIYHLSRNGWCEAAKEYLGDYIGISERSVIKIIKDLVKNGFVEKSGKQRLRTTEKWNNAIQKTKESGKKNKSLGEESSPTKVKKVHPEGEESSPTKVKKVHPEGEESSPTKVKKVHPEGEESSPHNNNSIITGINTVIIADESAEKIQAKYFHSKLIKTFYAGYESIYHEKLVFSKKEIGCIHTLVQTKILKYKTFEEQKEITKRKIDLLKDIALQKNKFQNWQFLPSQLLLHWDQLVEGCVQKNKSNNITDFKSNLEGWEKLEREYEAKHV